MRELIAGIILGLLLAAIIDFVSFDSGLDQCKKDHHVRSCIEIFIPFTDSKGD